MSLLRRIEKNSQTQQIPETAPVAPPPPPDLSGSKLEEIRIRRQAAAPVRDAQRELKERIHARLIAELDPKLDVNKTDEVRKNLETLDKTVFQLFFLNNSTDQITYFGNRKLMVYLGDEN